MSELVSYSLNGDIATITMDDGKVNALSPAMSVEVSAALDQADADGAVVVLTGRERTFSAGFDLRVPPEDWPAMLTDGAHLAEKLLSFPQPVVAACNGNAIAMGALLLLAVDERVGSSQGSIGLNEVAIGMTLPWFGIALARHRLTAAAFDRCTVTGPLLDPAAAAQAGFLDSVVSPEAVAGAAAESAARLAGLNRDAHAATKLRVRGRVLEELRGGIDRLSGPLDQL
jgi:enoyl-CoA hydratase